MGSVGDAYDNAMCESFFATLECELLERSRIASQAEAKMACFSFIEGWYNPVRLHSALGYQSPMAYESRQGGRYRRTHVNQVPQHSTKTGQIHRERDSQADRAAKGVLARGASACGGLRPTLRGQATRFRPLVAGWTEALAWVLVCALSLLPVLALWLETSTRCCSCT